jgi:hypothetical protein
VDTDGDVYPDCWNPGKSEEDSITGLKLDDFPDNPAQQLESDEEKRSDKQMDLTVFFVILIMVIVVLIITSLIVHKIRRHRFKPDDNEKILNNLKYDILHGETTENNEISSAELRELLDSNYQTGELSTETSEIIDNIIEESD